MSTLPTLHAAIRRSIPLWILLVGHVLAAFFLRNLGVGVDQIDDPQAMGMAHLLVQVHHLIVPWVATPAVLFIVFLQVQLIRGKGVAWGIDLMGLLLAIRCLVSFLMLNLLLLSHLKPDGLLLLKLLLFIPVITLAFGWLYWRTDTGGRAEGPCPYPIPRVRRGRRISLITTTWRP
ncbi:MAG: hypothetical protein ACOYMT_07625 [Chthoniobacterales bacterium]